MRTLCPQRSQPRLSAKTVVFCDEIFASEKNVAVLATEAFFIKNMPVSLDELIFGDLQVAFVAYFIRIKLY